jgi:hypothetical protein
MTAEELRNMGWNPSRNRQEPFLIQARTVDGRDILLIPQSDEEGNDAGALYCYGPTEADDGLLTVRP